jgi:hypothetical protein
MCDWKKSVYKGVKMAVVAVAAYAAGKGFELTADQQAVMITAGVAAFASLANALKHKWPRAFGWL